MLVSADESVANGPRSPPRHNYDPDHRRMVFGPMLTLSEFKRRVVEALNEYFSSEDAVETIGTLSCCCCSRLVVTVMVVVLLLPPHRILTGIPTRHDQGARLPGVPLRGSQARDFDGDGP